jgi:hypothetical protein
MGWRIPFVGSVFFCVVGWLLRPRHSEDGRWSQGGGGPARASSIARG